MATPTSPLTSKQRDHNNHKLNNIMNIEEIKKRQKILESRIAEITNNFNSRCGVKIDEIQVSKQGDNPSRIYIKIENPF